MKVSGRIVVCLLALACMTAGLLPAVSAARHKADGKSTTIVNTTQSTAIGLSQTTVAASRTVPAAKPLPAVSGNGARTMHMWDVEAKDTGGTLLFSDSPEYVPASGILYQDSIKGDARVLYYHLNDSKTPKKVAVVLENEGGQRAFVRVTRGGTSQPGTDYLEVGRNTQISYFDTKRDDILYIGAGEKRLLQKNMDVVVLQPGQLVYGVYDFSADASVKVSVIMYPADLNPLEFIKTARILPKDEHRLRGTFMGMDRVISSRKVYNPQQDGIVYIPLADNEADVYRTGIDATDGSLVTNYGNYGVLYRIEIPTQGSLATKYYLSPLGGVYAGAMTVTTGEQGQSSLLLTPNERAYFGDQTIYQPSAIPDTEFLTDHMELTYLGTYNNAIPLSFEYSPPGASNLPVNLILMPAADQHVLAPKPKKR
jgi:hypothetical protein